MDTQVIESSDCQQRAEGIVEMRSIPLNQLARGERGRVHFGGDDLGEGMSGEEVKMLRAMGLRPDASVTMCRVGEPCIVSLSGACGDGCRIGLAKEIAGRVQVRVEKAE